MKSFVVVIPARYSSTRFPGKPLKEILGKPMLLRTYEQAIKAVDPSLVWVATDSTEIAEFCKKNSIQYEMTSSECKTGTDRIAEFAEKVFAHNYINVQGDEPVFNPEDLKLLIKTVDGSGIVWNDSTVINGYAPIKDKEEFNSRSVPKVVFNLQNDLLYMSRSPIPGSKDSEFRFGNRQICLYSFTKKALKLFKLRNDKTPLELVEDIEILRFIEMGIPVQMLRMSDLSQPVDNPEDIAKVERIIKEREL